MPWKKTGKVDTQMDLEKQSKKDRAARRRELFRKGLRDGIPIAVGYISVSFSFGILASAQGLPLLAAVLMSLTNMTSAGQFAGLGIITGGGTFVEMALAQLVINLRYALMSLTISQKVDRSFTKLNRICGGFFVTDEIFAVSTSGQDQINAAYFYGLGLLPLAGWTLGTFLGAAAGNLLPADVTRALGVALYGMFVAIIIPEAKKSRAVTFVILTSALLSSILRLVPALSFVSSGFAVIICGLGASLLGAALFPIKEEELPEDDGDEETPGGAGS